MKSLIISILIFVLAGCDVGGTPTPSSSPPGHDEHVGHNHSEHAEEPDGDQKEEGFVTLTPAQQKELRVTTTPVVAASGQSTGLRPGRIEADPDRQVAISSQVSGTLRQLYAQVGAQARVGAIIAVISSPEVTSLQAEYHEAEVESELARKELANKTELFEVGDDIQRPLEQANLEVAQAKAARDSAAAKVKSVVLKNERLETLLKEGIASRQQVEESRADRKTVEADLEQTEAALKIAENHFKRETQVSGSRLRIKAETFPAEARLARASEQMRHAKERLQQLGASPHEHTGLISLSSPIDGIVVERPSSRGELVSPGEPVAVIVDSSRVWVWVDLQRSDLEVVEKGDPMEISLVEQPEQMAEGYLDYISPQLDKVSQTLKARVVLTDPPKGFRLGSFVNAKVTNGTGDSAPAIPQTSVQFVEGVTVVYRREKQGYRRTTVTLGAPVGDSLVVAKGVRVGDEVVLEGVEQLKSLDLADQIGGHQH
jgi:RND family efflux transporter MFP subunit